ncbi:RCC1 domain-containing protein [Paenibacillus cymbidii]|uniref:RCC1 domain-containing protein n=1 Tax=Paenibacillus cymbidii TaxID=1639034 RepID=UPI00108147E4|nr:S-layer homology domain-containing protein [Paenibacillus cymbidii]
MAYKIGRKASPAKWLFVWLSILLVWTCIAPAAVSAKSAAAGSRHGGSFQKIAAGDYHTVALTTDGTVVAWGDNSNGQTNVPAGLTGVVSVAAGPNNSAAMKADGTVVVWGTNGSGQNNVPSGLTNAVTVAVGSSTILALKADGTLVVWGSTIPSYQVPAGLTDVVDIAATTLGPNSFLALQANGTVVAWGSNTSVNNVPAGLTGVIKVAAGDYTAYALKSDGTVVAWGDFANLMPAGLTDVVDIAAHGGHAMAVKADGSIVAWGLSDGFDYQFPSGLTGIVAISTGYYHTVALKSDGTVVAWGKNNYRQLNVPADFSSPVKGIGMATGGAHTLALKSDGTVVAWGNNTVGQTNVPAGLNGVVAVAAGWYHSLALKSDRTVTAWGQNSYGILNVPTGLNGVTAIASGRFHSLALKADGTVVAWGANSVGQSTVPAWATGVTAIAAGTDHSLALRADGTVVAWGWNYAGQSNVPGALSGVTAIAAGRYHSLALKADGNVVVWGDNGNGQLDVPSGLNGVVAIAAGTNHSLALKADGTVVAWGDNSKGQTAVPADLNQVVAIAAGSNDSSFALKADGTIVAWGDNASGQTTLPGRNTDLNGLTLQEGDFDTAFSTSITGYTYSYIGPSVSGVHVTASLSDSSYAALYVNNQPQTSGSAATIDVTGASTVVPVRIEPYFLPSKTYTITILRDATPPDVHYSVYGNTVPSRSAATVVTVYDTESDVDPHSLQYVWTQTADVQAGEWTDFTSGATLTKAGADGEWYLHIQAKDRVGNQAVLVSDPFLLDNTGPSVDITMTTADASPYPDDTWTNQDVTVSASATDANSVTSVTYSLDSGAKWSGYNAPIVLQADSMHALSFKAVDAAGNETLKQRTVKISKSGLRLTPTLTQEGGSAYTSGDWTNGSVTVSVDAEAGASGIADLSYQLDGAQAQAYTSGTPVQLSQEGAHTLLFQVTDTAGNTLTAPLAVNIDLTAPVITLTGPSSRHITAGGVYTEEGATATDTGGSGVAGAVTVTGWVYANAPGTYSLQYRVSDRAGNEAAEVERTVIVDEAAAPPTAPSGGGSSTPVVKKPVIDLGGISFDPDAIDTSRPSVTLEVTPKDGTAVVSIPASILTNLENKNADFFIEIKTPYGSYQVPVNLASLIPGLKEWLAANNLQAGDISFRITLTDRSGDKGLQAAFVNGLPHGSVMGAMVDFHIDVLNSKSGQPIGKADRFNQALTRIIPLPKDQSGMPEQWGAFRYNEAANRFEFVPAQAKQIDGVWYVMISSYSNSAYAVADNETSFADVRGHWSRSFVELAASKGLVEGFGDGVYGPDRPVTRAEFAAMLVRALGQSASTGAPAPYADVEQGAWYFGAVAAAKELGLLGFAGGSSFKPDQPLAREEMASMLAAVVALEKLPIPGGLVGLDDYADIDSVDASYLEDVRLMVKLQIMTGMDDGTFSPKGQTTRAQAAVVFIRSLQRLGMID